MGAGMLGAGGGDGGLGEEDIREQFVKLVEPLLAAVMGRD